MGTQTEAVKEWLCRYQTAKRDFDHLCERITTLRAHLEAPRASSLDGMPHSPGFSEDQMGAAITRIDELERKAKALIDTARSLYHEENAAILRITGPGWPDMRAVLQMRYLDGASWSEVNAMLFGRNPDFEDRQDSFLRRTYKIHAAALDAISEFVPPGAGQEIIQKENDRK